MAKLSQCDRCRFYTHSPHMVCGINPCGPAGDTCPDFEPALATEADEPRQPLAGGYYAGDWIPHPFPMLTDEEQLALLNWHPMFTGRCPECETTIAQTDPPRVHWDCGCCGWKDEPTSQKV